MPFLLIYRDIEHRMQMLQVHETAITQISMLLKYEASESKIFIDTSQIIVYATYVPSALVYSLVTLFIYYNRKGAHVSYKGPILIFSNYRDFRIYSPSCID